MKKIQVLDVEGKKKAEIESPSFFSETIREDIIWKFLEAKRKPQPYGQSPVGGKQHSASGIIPHRRHVWKTHYGHGISRIPRKIISRRGNRFNWIGAEISSTVGGRRAHPPKSWKNFSGMKINKKEEKIAFLSALSATANEKYIKNKYETLKEKKIEHAPFIVENSIAKLKTKPFLNALKKIFNGLDNVTIPERSIRAGKGKMRGRKYKKKAGALVVVGKEDKIKINGIDIKKADKVSTKDLAKGGPGRLTLYTEDAIKQIQERINSGSKK